MSKVEIYNPNNVPVDDLPVIYGFSNGGSLIGGLHAVAMAEDGTYLGSHICSSEGFMLGDLGINEGTRSDRHEKDYQRHYPNGYRMEFVMSPDIEGHEKLQEALRLNASRAMIAKEGWQVIE